MGPADDGRCEVRGIIAKNGHGELCFFCDSRAEGVPILDANDDLLSIGALPELIGALQTAPRRRLLHTDMQVLDPVELGGRGTP